MTRDFRRTNNSTSAVHARRAALAAIAILMLTAASISAVELHVTDPVDAAVNDGLCSLSEAIANANGDDQSGSVDCVAGSSDDVIVLDVDVTLSVARSSVRGGGQAGTPNIQTGMTIRGGGRRVIADGTLRIFLVDSAGILTLEGVKVGFGSIRPASGGALGGCILSDGLLTVIDSSFEHCEVRGGKGGSGSPGGPATGGCIQAGFGSVMAVRSSFLACSATGGDGGDDAAGAGGPGGPASGGAMSANHGLSTIVDSTFSSCQATGGSGGTGAGGSLGTGGGAFGGGLSISSAVDIRGTFFNANVVRGGPGGFGGGGVGGGAVLSEGSVQSSTFAENRSEAPANAFSAIGGGLVIFGQVSLANSTFSANVVSGSNSPRGGGLFVSGSDLSVDSVTITASTGGGLFVSGVSAPVLRNSVIARQTSGPDCTGAPTAQNPNLASDSSCPGFSLLNLDPILAPLAVNAPGLLPTHALLPGSPAIDAGDTNLTADERGVARPQGVADDLGAFELDAAPVVAVPTLSPIACGLLVLGIALASFLLLRD